MQPQSIKGSQESEKQDGPHIPGGESGIQGGGSFEEESSVFSAAGK